MAKWRELKYYAHGTPCKTAKKHRRRHLFTWDFNASTALDTAYSSPCGLLVFGTRLSEGPTSTPKCGHCLKHVEKGNG
jgi:hypothetical protein